MADADISDGGRHLMSAWQVLDTTERIKLAFQAGAAATTPWWAHALKAVGEFASVGGAILGLVAGILAVLKVTRAGTEEKAKAGQTAASAVETASKAGARHPAMFAGVAVAVLTLGLYTWLTTRSARAEPMTTPAAQSGARARRRSSDDAGDTGDAGDAARDDDAPHMVEAFKWLGTHEARGSRSNPDVVAMFRDAGHPNVKNCISTPWCSAYAGACHERTDTPTRRNLMARSWLQWGVDATDSPQRGDVVVIWRGQRDDGLYGHVFFFLRFEGAHVVGIGGNQEDAVTIAKFPRSRILGIRRARPIAKSRIVKASVGQVVTGVATAGGGVTVAATVPEAPAPPVAVQAAEVAKPALERIADALPSGSRAAIYLAVIGGLLTIALGVYQYRRRVADHQEHGT
jgi:uncharacterized protein (TIGR02594 family)